MASTIGPESGASTGSGEFKPSTPSAAELRGEDVHTTRREAPPPPPPITRGETVMPRTARAETTPSWADTTSGAEFVQPPPPLRPAEPRKLETERPDTPKVKDDAEILAADERVTARERRAKEVKDLEDVERDRRFIESSSELSDYISTLSLTIANTPEGELKDGMQRKLNERIEELHELTEEYKSKKAAITEPRLKSTVGKKEPELTPEEKAERRTTAETEVKDATEKLQVANIHRLREHELTDEDRQTVVDYIRAQETLSVLKPAREREFAITPFQAQLAEEYFIAQKAVAISRAKEHGEDTAAITKDYNKQIARLRGYANKAEEASEATDAPAGTLIEDTPVMIKAGKPLPGKDPEVPGPVPPSVPGPDDPPTVPGPDDPPIVPPTPPTIPPGPPIEPPVEPRPVDPTPGPEPEPTPPDIDPASRYALAVDKWAQARINSEKITAGAKEKRALDEARDELQEAFEVYADNIGREHLVRQVEIQRHTRTAAGYLTESNNNVTKLQEQRALADADREDEFKGWTDADFDKNLQEQHDYQDQINQYLQEQQRLMTLEKAEFDRKKAEELMKVRKLVDDKMVELRLAKKPGFLRKFNNFLRKHPVVRFAVGTSLTAIGFGSAALGLWPLGLAALGAKSVLAGAGAYNASRGAGEFIGERQLGENNKATIGEELGVQEKQTGTRKWSKRVGALVGAGAAALTFAVGLNKVGGGPPDRPEPGPTGDRFASVNNPDLMNQARSAGLTGERFEQSWDHLRSVVRPDQLPKVDALLAQEGPNGPRVQLLAGLNDRAQGGLSTQAFDRWMAFAAAQR